MVVDGYEPCLVAVAYFEAGVGRNGLNRTILSTIAQWQEIVQLPAIIGADFNMSPKTLLDSTYVVRSGLCPVAPAVATYPTAKTATTIDYFLMATSFSEQVLEVEVLTDDDY